MSVRKNCQIYTRANTVALLSLLVYDWLLCLDNEVRFIWNWHARGVTITSLVYALSRYAWVLEKLLAVATIYLMSDLSCRVDVWTGTVMTMLGLIASSIFPTLRAYALSNRSLWLVITIILLALPPAAMKIIEQFYLSPMNLPNPLNCSSSSSLPPTLSVSDPIIARVSQLIIELLVVGITWWYTYQSYRIQRRMTLGKTLNSLLFYNGSMYFLCLAILYILDVVLNVSSLPEEVFAAASNFDLFIDRMVSILTCHFMLSLRKFDSTIMSMTSSRLEPHLREHMASTVLEFGAQPSDSLPAAIASFAHPVHVDSDLLETVDLDDIVNNGSQGRDTAVVAPAPSPEGPGLPCQRSPTQPAELVGSV